MMGWVFVFTSCFWLEPVSVTDAPWMDRDGDGFSSDTGEADCDDNDPNAWPGAPERVDGIDNDCDGEIDEGWDTGCANPWTLFLDADGDGFGGVEVTSCDTGLVGVAVDGDCNDANPAVHPDAVEDCATAADDDCDGIAPTCRFEGERDSSGSLAGEDPADGFGARVVTAELTGDEFVDLLVAAPGYPDGEAKGAVYIVPGPPPAGSSSATDGEYHHFLGGSDGDMTGTGISVCVSKTDTGQVLFAVGLPQLTAVEGTPLGRVALFDATGAAESNSLWDAVATYTGATDQLYAGVSVSCEGDLDGDGWADLAIGDGHERGRVYIAPGPHGEKGLGQDLGDTSSFARRSGLVEGSGLGSHVAIVEDMDGDGMDELVAGAPFPGGNRPTGQGLLYVYRGPVTGAGGSADAVFAGEPGTEEGVGTLTTGGDFDRDGHGDLLISAPGVSGETDDVGAAYLVLGPVDGVLDSTSSELTVMGDYEGTGVSFQARMVDLDQDGAMDLVTFRQGARVTVHYGPLEGAATLMTSSADAHWASEEEGWLAQPADISGDGHLDLVLGQVPTGGVDSGTVQFVLGGTP